MFMISGNRTAREQTEEARQILAEIREKLDSAEQELSALLSQRTERFEHIARQTYPRFEEAYMPVKQLHFKGSEIAYTGHDFEAVGEARADVLRRPESTEIPPFRSGLAPAALLGGFIASAVLFAAAALYTLAAGSETAVPSLAEAGAGTGILAAVWLGSTALLYRRRARRNLARSQTLLATAKLERVQLDRYLQKLRKLNAFLASQVETMRTLQIFLDEYAARLVRIVHTEGENYSTYSETSKGDVHLCVELYHAMRGLYKTAVLSPEGAVRPEAAASLARAEQMADRLMRPYQKRQPEARSQKHV